MNCKSCGKKMIYVEREYAPDTFDCECGEWAEAQMAFNEMKAQKEKAEAELKAIKAIWSDGEYLDNARETLKLIEKIGGG